MKAKDLLFKRLLFAIIFSIIVSKTTFAQAPTITSFTPSFGSIGTLVTITGNNLNNLDTIKIGGVSAIKISSTTSSLVAMVMPRAVTGKIYLTNNSGNAISVNNFIKTNSVPPSVQQGNKLIGTDSSAGSAQGWSVSISADGNTAIVGDPFYNVQLGIQRNMMGAAWIYTRSGGVWSQQGNKLAFKDNADTNQHLGFSVSISADGNTAIVGTYGEGNGIGGAWIFVRNNGVWTQQGNKLVGTGSIGQVFQGRSVSISADGNTAIIGGAYDNDKKGAAWIFKRSNGIWTQQGNKLVGTGSIGPYIYQGCSVGISGDGNTAIVGGYYDNNIQGAAWIYERNQGFWSQQGNKLVGTGNIGSAQQGKSVSISADGNTVLIGGETDSNYVVGATWVFVRNGGVWTQQSKLIGTGNIGASRQGGAITLSADGNTALIGGLGDSNTLGATWLFTRNGNVWTQKGNKLIGTGYIGKDIYQGGSVSISADGNTSIIGGYGDGNVGAVWVFTGAPTISTIGTLTPFSACSTNNSNPQSFTVEGAGLSSGNILITAQAGFEISTLIGSGYGSSINLTPVTGTVANTTIYVRLSSSAIGNLTGDIVCSATNATSQNISVSGTVNLPPTIGNISGNTTPNSLSSPFTYSVSNQPNSTYFWIATNGTIQSGQGTNAVNVVWHSAVTGNLNAKITNSNSCTDSTVLPIKITNIGLNNLSLENDLTVYPNPTKTNITINNKINLVGKKYIITNVIGQTVISGKLNLNETTVNLETLQSGMYFLSLDGLSKQSIKVIKE